MFVREMMEELRRIDPDAKVIFFNVRLVTQTPGSGELKTWVWKDNGPDFKTVASTTCVHGIPISEHCEECGKTFKHNADHGVLQKKLEGRDG